MRNLSTEVRAETFLSRTCSSRISESWKKFEAAAVWIEASIGRHALAWTAAFSGFYFAMTMARSYSRLMWADELITLWVCRFKSLPHLWSILKSGVELNPPLFHWVTRASETLFGENATGLRVPAMLSYWVMSLALYAYARKHVSALFALFIAVFPSVTSAYSYACEARPYPIILACSIVLLLFWRQATENGRYRRLAILGTGVMLAFAVSIHYYAVLMVLPVAAGEAVRLFERKTPDWPLWAAVAAGSAVEIAFLPLVRANLQIHKSPYAWNSPHLEFLWESYQTILGVALVPAIAVLAACAIRWSVKRMAATANQWLLPPHETAACITLTLLPVAAYALGISVTGMVSERYVIETALGFSVLFGLGVAQLSRNRSGAALALLAAVVVCFSAQQVTEIRRQYGIRNRYRFLQAQDVALAYDLPIVQKDIVNLLPLTYYGPREFTSRLVYLVDLDVPHRFGAVDTGNKMLANGRAIFPVHVEDLQPFLQHHDRFLIYGGPEGWLEAYLLERGARIQVVLQEGGELLLLVTQHPNVRAEVLKN